MELGKMQRKWVEALESGKFKQCRRKLWDGEGFCCLGVARIVLGVKSMNFFSAILEREEGEALGLRGVNGHTEGGLECLSALNDGGEDFKGIAARLRQEPEKWFTHSV